MGCGEATPCHAMRVLGLSECHKKSECLPVGVAGGGREEEEEERRRREGEGGRGGGREERFRPRSPPQANFEAVF